MFEKYFQHETWHADIFLRLFLTDTLAHKISIKQMSVSLVYESMQE